MRTTRQPGCWVAVLQAQNLMGRDPDCSVYLSAAERERHQAFANPKRRLQWLAGRLTAKYLFLHRLEMGLPNDAQGRPALFQLTAQSLDAFPDWMYQEVEVVPASTDADGAGARFRWRGITEQEALSISHTDTEACACLCAQGTVGIDLESVAPRVEAFYRLNYTEGENQWVNRGASMEPLSRDWLYTLLWTFKEAALKARAALQKNPLSFAGIGFSGLPAPEDVLWAYRARTWSERLNLFSAIVEEEGSATTVHVAYVGTRSRILTVVKPFGH